MVHQRQLSSNRVHIDVKKLLEPETLENYLGEIDGRQQSVAPRLSLNEYLENYSKQHEKPFVDTVHTFG